MTDQDPHSTGAGHQRPEVGYVARFVPGYRMAVMREAAKRLTHGLIVASGLPPGGSGMSALMDLKESGSEGLQHLPLANRWIRGEWLHWQESGPLFGPQGPSRVLLVEESPRTLSLRPLLRRARRRSIKTILWGHFSSIHRPLSSDSWRDRQRLKTASMADALLTYTDPLREELAARLPSQPIFTARNTLDTGVLFPIGDALLNEGRSAIRSRLGLADVPTLLFLGRMIPEKGPLRVVETAQALAQERVGPVSVVMIGDGPERSRIEALSVDNQVQVTCTGALADLETSAPWIAACDVLLNPGYLGLSVNHALALGVPVVAPLPGPDGTGHSPEWVYVRDGHNGRLAGSADIADLRSAVMDVLNDVSGYQERSARYAREELGIDRMIDGMMQAIHHVAPDIVLSRQDSA